MWTSPARSVEAHAEARAQPRVRISRRALLCAGAGSALAACYDESPLARGRQRLNLWFTYGGKNRTVLESLIERFNRTQRDVFVHAVFQGDYYEGLAKLRVALAAHAGPGLSHVVGEVLPYLAEASVLAPLGERGARLDEGIVPALGQRGSFVGGAEKPLYCLPFNRSTPIAYLNGALFAAAGLRAPTSWDELRATARELSLGSPGRRTRYGFGCPTDWWFWAALVGQAGGKLVEADGKITLGGEAGVQALDLWRTLVLRDGSMKPPPGRDYNAWEQSNQDFLSGRVAMIWSSTAFLNYLEENARFPVLAAPLPQARRFSVPTGGTHWVVPEQTGADERSAAFRFLSFMLEPAQAIEWANRTGYIPVTRDAVSELEQSGHFARHQNQRVAVDQLAVAEPWPWSTHLFRIQRELVQPRLERAVLGERSARELLAEARALAGAL